MTLQYNLPGRYYYAPSVLQLENERIFATTWQIVGCVSSSFKKAGDYIALKIANVPVFVILGDAGKLHAFQNMCTHRGATLLDSGAGQCLQLRCPYHGWEFNLSGELTDTPWFGETSPFDLKSLSLRRLSIDVWRGLVFVSIAPQQTLLEQLGSLPDVVANIPIETYKLDTTRKLNAEINWKTYIDQFVEAYHLEWVHPASTRGNSKDWDTKPLDNMMIMAAKGSTRDLAYFGGRAIWGWPNWTIVFFPGGMKINRLNPSGPASFEANFAYYFDYLSEETQLSRQKVVNGTEEIFREDVAICTRAQNNFSSGSYVPGPLHPNLEEAVAYFQSKILDALR